MSVLYLAVCQSQPPSLSLPLPRSPVVTERLFSTSVTLFLLCKFICAISLESTYKRYHKKRKVVIVRFPFLFPLKPQTPHLGDLRRKQIRAKEARTHVGAFVCDGKTRKGPGVMRRRHGVFSRVSSPSPHALPSSCRSFLFPVLLLFI